MVYPAKVGLVVGVLVRERRNGGIVVRDCEVGERMRRRRGLGIWGCGFGWRCEAGSVVMLCLVGFGGMVGVLGKKFGFGCLVCS